MLEGVAMTTTTTTTAIDYGRMRPKRTNRAFIFRAGLLTLVLAGAIGFVVYQFVFMQVTGGVVQKAGYYDVDLKAMSVFPFDQSNGKINDIPKKWRELDGKKVVVYGEMWDAYSAGSRLAKFQLCYSIAKCCFNGPPQVQHFVDCKVIDGADVGVYPNLVRVKGTLHVNVKYEEGKVKSVYQMEVESVDPA